MATKKLSNTAARRAAAEARDRFQPRELPGELQELLDSYTPAKIPPARWAAIRPAVNDAMARTRTTGVDKFRKQRNWVTQLFDWAHQHELPLEVTSLFTVGPIQRFTSTGRPGDSDSSRATKRSELLEIARQINPRFDGPLKGEEIGRARVKPPYGPRGTATIVRIARTQPTGTRRRQMCAVVGLGLGAGLDSTDLRPLCACHVVDHGVDGIEITVTGRRPRTVWVDEEYRELVREGVAGLRPNALVIGQKRDRNNVAAGVIESAVVHGDAPRIEQARLRATWLARQISQPIPLLSLMEAAGLQSVQTLVDIARFLLAQEEDER